MPEKSTSNDSLLDILEQTRLGDISIEDAKDKIVKLGIKQVGERAKLDILRKARTGIHETVFAQNKEPEDVAGLLIELAKENKVALATRVKDEDLAEVKKVLPDELEMDFNEKARTIVLRRKGYTNSVSGNVGVLAAGTSDIPVAEEACVTLEVMGCRVIKSYDVGISGIHRLFDPIDEMLESNVDAVVAVAGMEGALPSVVAGLVDVAVIGVPTSVGYGAGGGGVSALLTMLQSCSPGLAVVNIDNGFGAGVFAGLISKRKGSGHI
ncbi:MAG: nickel pincer cofactor biosynthesis protein LarB [Halobacteriota archaeon]|nr:nickel pincer cofactor biosynthesis protein LarB [Halobacteriota archaeon]